MDWPVVQLRGLSPADAVDVGSYPMLVMVLNSQRCPCGGVMEPAAASVLHPRGRRMLERQDVRCTECSTPRSFWFDITRFHGDPDAGERYEHISTLMREALTLVRSGLLDRALPRLQEAVAREPAFGVAWFHLAMVQLGQGQPEQALRSMQSAAAWCPVDADVHNGLARVLVALERTEQAARQVRIAQTIRAVLDATAPRE